MFYVIVQAGGKGSRLQRYTYNKPKALLSVDGVPLILRVFKTFRDAHFLIIADYKHEVLQKYLLAFASNVKYTILHTSMKGTCAGIKDALNYIPDDTPFVLTWCDLYFGDNFKLNVAMDKNYVGISKSFVCRWSFKDGRFFEKSSCEDGVAGFFIFKNKDQISDVPLEGEFVRYLSSKELEFERLELNDVKEFGTIEEYEKLFTLGVSRPFNTVKIGQDYVEKTPVDPKGHELFEREKKWYQFVSKYNFHNIPKVISYEPFRLERIFGKHPFEMEPHLSVVKGIINALMELHNICGYSRVDYLSVDKEYFIKTFERLYQVRNLIPHSDKKEIKINGKICLNPFYVMDTLKLLLKNYYPDVFKVIHGDPTFSNTLVGLDGKVYFIDPRGYFGYTYIYGDEDYDFAKLYYSVVGNYDKFNRKRFTLKIHENEVELEIESSGYELYGNEIMEAVGKKKEEKIKLLHAIIWLSLTTYAWDDYDMICGAFYNGTAKLMEVLR